ncbi:MAG: carbon-nitrogen hydrolase family protein [Phycisphaerae bacterium]
MRFAVAQVSPVFLDRLATTQKAANSIRAAAAKGAKLVAFGETLIPAYPLWLSRTDGARFEAADQKELHALYLRESVNIDRGDLAPLCDAACDCRIAVVVGIAERATDRGGHSIYCSCVFIAADGQIKSVHRKLMPTYEERLAWAIGDGAGLVTHAVGEFTVGALNCWENWMPLARTALYAAGENLHVAIWPGCKRLTEDITRFIAREGRSFVISASSIIRGSDIPTNTPQRSRIVASESELLYDGGSCIAGPDGAWIVEPVVGREELIVADLDLTRVYEERQSFDPVGHYARPDVLRLSVSRERQGGLA